MEASRKFLFKLCVELGYKSIAELEQQMSHNELLEWVEYYSSEPFMADRIELQLATLTDVIIKTHTSAKDVSAVDFMITVSEEQRKKQKNAEQHHKVVGQLKDFGI